MSASSPQGPTTRDRGAPPPEDPSVADLVKQATEQTTHLVRSELELAKLELQEKAKHAGIGVGMFGAAGVIALYGVGALVATAILLLATAVDAWIAALIVAVVLFAAAGVAALLGKKQVEQGVPPAPEAAVASAKRDVDEVKAAAKR